MSYCKEDIIIAQATPVGHSALAILRVSGLSLNKLHNQLTGSKKIKPRFALTTKVYHPMTRNVLDNSIVIFFASPSSFTGEDMIEITCHGGKVITENIIKAILEWGARPALPGEFSFRAYINGKLDLVQAEATAALINSKTSLSVETCLNALDGNLKKQITSIRLTLINLLSILENELDFSENEIDYITYNEISKQLVVVKQNLNYILSSSTFGKTLHSGIRVVLIGRANAGKSSLFNALLGQNRSIVSKKKGTTRDFIESWIDLDGIPVCLVDTAGFHESTDFLDNLSIQHTKRSIAGADIFIIIDDYSPINLLKTLNFNKNNDNIIFVCSKSDLKKKKGKEKNIIHTSITEKKGINTLLSKLSLRVRRSASVPDKIDTVIISGRQRIIIKQALRVLNDCLCLVDSHETTDIISSMLREFVKSLEGLYIVVDENEVINNIFKNFCIGK